MCSSGKSNGYSDYACQTLGYTTPNPGRMVRLFRVGLDQQTATRGRPKKTAKKQAALLEEIHDAEIKQMAERRKELIERDLQDLHLDLQKKEENMRIKTVAKTLKQREKQEEKERKQLEKNEEKERKMLEKNEEKERKMLEKNEEKDRKLLEKQKGKK